MKKIALLTMIFITYQYMAAETNDSVPADTVVQMKKSLYRRIVDYFDDSNKTKPQKDFDISFIGGPHYSSDTKFGIGIVAAGTYRHDKTDTITQPSNVSLYGDATTSMFFKLGVRGTNFYSQDNRRLSYDVNFASVYSKFWGIGYDYAIHDSNESNYKYLSSEAKVEFVWRIKGQWYAGPIATFDYINARDREKIELWQGESHRIFSLGAGFTIQYDTRDCMTCSTKGLYLCLNQVFRPRFLTNKYAFSMTELTGSTYHGLWNGGALASILHARFTYGDTPWNLLSKIGGSNNMRGYYEGRYRDKCEADICIELRQHIWRRNGVVAWIGAGTVFPEFKEWRSAKILPNYGIGYRWEFKKSVNVRLDLGFGHHQTGFIFSINEAF